jgi:hypothetical protein
MKTVAPTPLWNEPVRNISPLDVVNRIGQNVHIRMVGGEKDNVAPPSSFTERYAAVL